MCDDKATVVDHIEPSKGRLDVFERTSNHLALCTLHHNTITGKFDYRFAPGGDMAPKLNWLGNERASYEARKGTKFPAAKVLRYKE